MKHLTKFVLTAICVSLLLTACNNQPPLQNSPSTSPSASPFVPSPTSALPDKVTVNVRREGSEEEIVAHKTNGSNGLTIYLFPKFMLTQDEGFDILIPKPDSGYLPVSMTISRNTEDLSVDEALERAMSFYPNVSFEPTIFDYTLSGNIETVKCVWGKLDNDWVICVGMEGENGTVSAWGQGGAETAEGLQVLVLSQLSTIVLQ